MQNTKGQGNRSKSGKGDRHYDDHQLDKQSKESISGIIKSGFNKPRMDFVNDFGKRVKGVTSSQIRIAYGEVIRLKMKENVPIGEVLMLKPKLAYAAGRATSNKNQYKLLRDVISHAVDITCEEKIDSSEQTKRFKNLASLFEAILAYHKTYGGK